MSIGGSSPHTRGAPARPGHPAPVAGIIPAYAGSTTYDKTGSYLEPDHPRIRGEHENTPPGFNARVGSSPHTRGARGSVRAGRCRIGIIPAYAGSTPPAPKSRNTGRDHPRIRGEHERSGRFLVGSAGSSPHTRGALTRLRRILKIQGIIPAYAGSTSSYPTCELPRTDHPRIRGEHLTPHCRHS